jgi:hypothetical protein
VRLASQCWRGWLGWLLAGRAGVWAAWVASGVLRSQGEGQILRSSLPVPGARALQVPAVNAHLSRPCLPDSQPQASLFVPGAVDMHCVPNLPSLPHVPCPMSEREHRAEACMACKCGSTPLRRTTLSGSSQMLGD